MQAVNLYKRVVLPKLTYRPSSAHPALTLQYIAHHHTIQDVILHAPVVRLRNVWHCKAVVSDLGAPVLGSRPLSLILEIEAVVSVRLSLVLGGSSLV